MASKPKSRVPAVPPKGQEVVALPRSPLDGYQVSKQITSNLLSLNHHPEMCVRVEGEIIYQDSQMTTKDGGKAMAVCEVTDLETGEIGFLIVPTVLESAFKRVRGGYIGKSFLIRKAPPLPGKRYMNVDLYELQATVGARAMQRASVES